jgi:hypothetical protein
MATMMNMSAVRRVSTNRNAASVSSASASVKSVPVFAKASRKVENFAMSTQARRDVQALQTSRRNKVATRALNTVAALATDEDEGEVDLLLLLVSCGVVYLVASYIAHSCCANTFGCRILNDSNVTWLDPI